MDSSCPNMTHPKLSGGQNGEGNPSHGDPVEGRLRNDPIPHGQFIRNAPLPCIPERREEEFERFRGNFDSTKSSSTFSEQGFEICPWLKLAERGKESVKPLSVKVSVPGSHEFFWSSGGLHWNSGVTRAKYPQKKAI